MRYKVGMFLLGIVFALNSFLSRISVGIMSWMSKKEGKIKRPLKDESSSSQGRLANRTTELAPSKYHKCQHCGIKIGDAVQLPGCSGGGE
jgi:hypothetical protein